MSIQTSDAKTYTITETAKISGLSESTLRYYETIGLIKAVGRDVHTKRRVYNDDDVNDIIGVACLSAIGLSIDEMRQYQANWQNGKAGADNQVELLTNQMEHIKSEMHLMKLRLKYVENKVEYWKAMAEGDETKKNIIGEKVYAIAKEMKLPARF